MWPLLKAQGRLRWRGLEEVEEEEEEKEEEKEKVEEEEEEVEGRLDSGGGGGWMVASGVGFFHYHPIHALFS